MAERRVVVDEDVYTDALAAIIERDYFPNLAKYRAQEDYLDALDRNDMGRLQVLKATFARQTQTPGSVAPSATPRLPFATPAAAVGTGSDAGLAAAAAVVNRERDERLKAAGVRIDMSLEAFQMAYTSEDDASFNKLVDRLNKKHRERYHWLYAQGDRKRSDHLLEAPTSQVKGLLTMAGEAGATATSGALVHVPGAAAETGTLPLPPGAAVDDRKPLEFWDFKARNTLMYYPEGSELNALQRKQATADRPQVNYDVFKMPLPVQKPPAKPGTAGDPGVGKSAEMGEIARFIHRQALQQGGLTPSAHTPAPPPESPRIGGYGFVPSTPALVPGVDATPMMTWGTIEGTPLLLDPSMTPLRPGERHFHMPPESKREQLASKLAEDATRKKRRSERSNKAAMLTPKSPLVSTLLTGKLSGSDAQLRASYGSPLLRGTPRASPAVKRPPSGRLATPSKPRSTSVTTSSEMASAVTPQAAAAAATEVTDDLLRI